MSSVPKSDWEQKYLKLKEESIQLKKESVQLKEESAKLKADLERFSYAQDAMHDLLTCPVCFLPLMPLIRYICANGHTVCDECKLEIGNTCPTCKSPFLETKNLTLLSKLINLVPAQTKTEECSYYVERLGFYFPKCANCLTYVLPFSVYGTEIFDSEQSQFISKESTLLFGKKGVILKLPVKYLYCQHDGWISGSGFHNVLTRGKEIQIRYVLEKKMNEAIFKVAFGYMGRDNIESYPSLKGKVQFLPVSREYTCSISDRSCKYAKWFIDGNHITIMPSELGIFSGAKCFLSMKITIVETT